MPLLRACVRVTLARVGGLVEVVHLVTREERQRVAVLAVEQARVADDRDDGVGGALADLVVDEVEPARQGVVDVVAGVVHGRRARVAGERDHRLGALGDDAREAGVVAADRDRHELRAGVEARDLAVEDVLNLRAATGDELEAASERRLDQVRVRVDAPLAALVIRARAGAGGVGVSHRDVVGGRGGARGGDAGGENGSSEEGGATRVRPQPARPGRHGPKTNGVSSPPSIEHVSTHLAEAASTASAKPVFVSFSGCSATPR